MRVIRVIRVTIRVIRVTIRVTIIVIRVTIRVTIRVIRVIRALCSDAGHFDSGASRSEVAARMASPGRVPSRCSRPRKVPRQTWGEARFIKEAKEG